MPPQQFFRKSEQGFGMLQVVLFILPSLEQARTSRGWVDQ